MMANETSESDLVKVIRCEHCQDYDPGFVRPYLGWCSAWEACVRESGYCYLGKPRGEEPPKASCPPQEKWR